MIVETKEDGEEFETYDPNNVVIKIIQWRDEYAEDDTSINEKCKDVRRLNINKHANVQKLLQTIAEQYEIEMSQLKVFKKSYVGTGGTSETISQRIYYDFTVTQARIYDGTILLIEKIEVPGVRAKW